MAKKYQLVAQPFEAISLFPAQRNSLYRIREVEKTGKVLIREDEYTKVSVSTNVIVIGDEPGFGKTLVALSRAASNDGVDHPLGMSSISTQRVSNVEGTIRVFEESAVMNIKTNLIIVPPNIVKQWCSEAERVGLSVHAITSHKAIADLEKYDIVVCQTTFYNDLAKKYSRYRFKRFIYDEIDSAYIVGMCTIHAAFYIFISATFDHLLTEILRSHKEHFMKRMFGKMISDSYSTEDVLNAITIVSPPALRALTPVPSKYNEIYYNIKSANMAIALREFMKDELIQMIESGNIREAIKRLGGGESDHDIATLMRKRAESSLADANENYERYVRKGSSGADLAEKWRIRIIEEQNKLDSIHERIANVSMSECVLCSNVMENPVLYGCCQSIICGKCIVSWNIDHEDCPFCRAKDPAIVRLHHYAAPGLKIVHSLKEITHGSKLEILENLSKSGEKILIIASYDDSFKMFGDAFDKKGISHDVLRGNAANRAKIIDSFTGGKLQVLFLNNQLNAAGLNLQVGTRHVVLLHPMPVAFVKQAIGRVLRHGLDHEITVHKMYAKKDEMTH